jgi:hypothetical protein
VLDPVEAPISTEDVEEQPELSLHASGSSPKYHITGHSKDGQIVQNSLVPITIYDTIFWSRTSAAVDNRPAVDLQEGPITQNNISHATYLMWYQTCFCFCEALFFLCVCKYGAVSIFITTYEGDEQNTPNQGRWITKLFVKQFLSSRCTVTLLCDSLERGMPKWFLTWLLVCRRTAAFGHKFERRPAYKTVAQPSSTLGSFTLNLDKNCAFKIHLMAGTIHSN